MRLCDTSGISNMYIVMIVCIGYNMCTWMYKSLIAIGDPMSLCETKAQRK